MNCVAYLLKVFEFMLKTNIYNENTYIKTEFSPKPMENEFDSRTDLKTKTLIKSNVNF